MMESVLEDVPLPDTYSHNMVSSSDSLRRALSVPEPIDEINSRLPRLSDESTSLNNLTQAILNRRKVRLLFNLKVSSSSLKTHEMRGFSAIISFRLN